MRQTLQQMQQDFQDSSRKVATPVEPPPSYEASEVCTTTKPKQPISTQLSSNKSPNANAYVETDI